MSNRGLFALIAVCAVALIVMLARSGGGGALDYVGSWTEAQALASYENKPILLNFGGDW